MSYNIFLDNKKIGSSNLEKADAPMGVVFGKINFNDVNLNYSFFSNYCKINLIKTEEYSEDKFISTQTIPALQVYNQKEVEIKGIGCYIEGMDSEGFEINIIGISYPFYEDEFPHHANDYRESFK
jgi:hypothetical protein